MDGRTYVSPAGVAPPAGPYQHAAVVDGWLFIAGQIPTDANDSAAPLPVGIEAQTERVFRNIGAVLSAAGYGFSDVVQVRNYLVNLERDMAGFNTVYAQHFSSTQYPPRTTVGVAALAKGALVEVDLIAYRPRSS